MKTWEQPKLIMLIRGQPEEAVLGACKGLTVAIGSATFHKNCFEQYGVLCVGCNGIADS